MGKTPDLLERLARSGLPWAEIGNRMRELIDLAITLRKIDEAERVSRYDERFGLILKAMGHARGAGYEVGFAYDGASGPDMDGYRIVVHIELGEDGGQFTWHMPEHAVEWDGHSTADKYDRISAFAKRVLGDE